MIAHDVIRRPGLGYQYAFDWLAVSLYAAGDPVAYAVGAEWQLAEMARRLPRIPALDMSPAVRAAVAAALGLPDIPAADGESLRAVGIIEPADLPRRLFDRLEPGGCLYAVTGGVLARFLAERRGAEEHSPLGERALVATARTAGFRVVARLGVHSPAAVMHHYAGRMALAAGRRDVHDRCQHAMRRAMVTFSAAGLAALVCLALERKL
jgi:hypothetical protein